MQPSELKSEMQECKWIFDFFAIGFDYLSSRMYASEDILDRLASGSSRAFRDAISNRDGGMPASIHDFLGVPNRDWSQMTDTGLEAPDFHFKLLYVLWQIDRAALDLNYFCKGGNKALWPSVREHLERNHLSLHRDFARRVIIRPPPLAAKHWWSAALKLKWSIVERGQHLDRLFQNLIRVPEVLGADITLLNRMPALFDRVTSEDSSFKIGIVPLVHDIRYRSVSVELLPGPLHIVPHKVIEFAQESGSRHEVSRFGIEVIEGDGTQTMDFLAHRAAAATQSACDRGVEVLLFPELVVPDAVVNAISTVLRDNFQRGESTPRVTLAGTFGRASTDGKNFNEAVILDGSGRELYRQRKMHAYKMFEYEQQKYNLVDLFQNLPRQEDFDTFPRRVTFLDSRAAGYRIVTLICEDAAQENPGREAVAALHPTIVFVPVMAGALEKGCWCWETASLFARRPGAVAIVANSGALAKAQFAKQGRTDHPPLAIVGAPLADPAYNNVRASSCVDKNGLILLNIP
jgi:hypothetical protein